MKILLFAMGILASTAVLHTSAQAQNYPWCAYYGGGANDGENCGFSTREQCMTTVSGIGGFCALNTQYVPPAGAAHPSHRPRHGSHKHPT